MNQNRYIYLFGANGPTGMQLQYAESDVQRLYAALEGAPYRFTGKHVIANSRDDALDGLEESIKRCQASDLLLVHFSGHAILDKGQLYLICNKSHVNSLRRSAIDIRDVKGYLQDCKARQKVLILDCCRAGAAHAGGPFKEKGDDSDGIRAALQDTARGSASIIFSACSHRHTTRELTTLDGGSGFLSWLIRAACTDRFHAVSGDGITLSLDDIMRWSSKALAEVNATLSAKEHLTLPHFLCESVGSAPSEICLTDPPAAGSLKHSYPDANRTKYLQNVYKCYSTVTLPIGPTEGFSLQAIFQPLALRSDPLTIVGERQKRRPLLGESSLDGEEALFPDAKDRHAKQQSDEQLPEPHKTVAEHGEDALKKSPHGRIIILGGPGTGKTTTLKHLVGKRAEEALNDPSTPIPIYLSLVDLARSSKTLQSYLSDLVEKLSIERSYAEILWQEIERGHAFVALDSLDEVDPRQRPDIIDMINNRASEKGNTWLVGSRFSEYKGGQFKRGQFCEWELLVMTPELRCSLTERLFPELYRLFAITPSDPLSPSTFIGLLEKPSQAATWGENPLLLSLAAVIYVKTGGLPASRALLYRDVIDAVLATREPSELESSHLLRHLRNLALWLYQRRKRIFTGDDLFTFLEGEQKQSFQDAGHIAQRLIASGILDHLAHGTYSFRHQTFQEYLAGASLAMQLTDYDPTLRQKAWDLAWSKRAYSRWTEILRLMVGVLVQLPNRNGPAKALHWLKELVAQRTSEQGDPGDLGLALALQSLGEVADAQMWKSAHVLPFQRQVLTLWLDALSLRA